MSLSSLPSEIIGNICRFATSPTLIALSRADKRCRTVVLREFESRFELNLPSIDEKNLGADFKATVQKLRSYFGAFPKLNISNPLTGLLGYTPDFSASKIALIDAIPMRSLSFIRFLLQTPHDLRNSSKNEETELLEAGGEAYSQGQFRMGDEIYNKFLEKVSSGRKYTLNSSEFLLLLRAALRSGNNESIDKIEGLIDTHACHKAYGDAHIEVILSAHTSNKEQVLDHVFKRLREAGNLCLNAGLIEIISRMKGSPLKTKILEFAVSLPIDRSILPAVYRTKDITIIDACRKKLNLDNSPDPLELSYACNTASPQVVQYTLSKMKSCDTKAATRAACISFNLDILTLLLKNNLFQFDASESDFYSNHLIEKAESVKALYAVVELFLNSSLTTFSLLKAAYKTKALSLIQASRAKLELNNHPDRNELTYAVTTEDPAIVEFTISKVKRETSDIVSASEAACCFFDLSIVELLAKNRLFRVDQAIAIFKLFITSALRLGEVNNRQTRLFQIIDSMDRVDAMNLISNSAYIESKKGQISTEIYSNIWALFEESTFKVDHLMLYFDHNRIQDKRVEIIDYLLSQGCRLKDPAKLDDYIYQAFNEGNHRTALNLLKKRSGLSRLRYWTSLARNISRYQAVATPESHSFLSTLKVLWFKDIDRVADIAANPRPISLWMRFISKVGFLGLRFLAFLRF